MIPTSDGAEARHFNRKHRHRCGRMVVVWPSALALCAAAFMAPALADDLRPELRLLALGDSLVAGYGLPEAEGFTAQLEAALRDEGWNVSVLDGGVSGDTTAGGRSRLDWVLADEPDAVLVALGANDALRGLDPGDTRSNLEAILSRLVEEEGLPTLLAGMYAPPNFGRDFEASFNSIYPDLAAEYPVQYFPFFLEDVAMVEALNQQDGIHPTAEGVAIMVDNLLPLAIEILTEASDRVGTHQEARGGG
jgi:acyl-CoA thioesterase I